MLELCSIASGSSGNCICVGNDDEHILIDAGISGKRIENGLAEFDLKGENVFYLPEDSAIVKGVREALEKMEII